MYGLGLAIFRLGLLSQLIAPVSHEENGDADEDGCKLISVLGRSVGRWESIPMSTVCLRTWDANDNVSESPAEAEYVCLGAVGADEEG